VIGCVGPARTTISAIAERAGHALAFSMWRSLSREGLSDREAASLMAALILSHPPK
jgi:hypothetical protein